MSIISFNSYVSINLNEQFKCFANNALACHKMYKCVMVKKLKNFLRMKGL